MCIIEFLRRVLSTEGSFGFVYTVTNLLIDMEFVFVEKANVRCFVDVKYFFILWTVCK